MTDEDQALNNGSGEDTAETSTPLAEQTIEESQETTEQPEPTGEGEAEESKEESSSTNKGASARIRELNARAKRESERAESLAKRLEEITNTDQSQRNNGVAPYNPEEPLIKPGEEIDGSELSNRIAQREQRILQTAEARAELRMRQSEAIGRIRSESQEVLREYPELDPNSDVFDQELSDSITEATESHVRSNPYTASPKKFVEKLMKPYRRSVDKQVGQERENLAKQVSQSATRPTGISTSGKKSYAEKSIKELEAELGIDRY